MIWDGPRNQDGQRIWFGLDPGTNLTAVNGTPPFFLGVTQFHWDEHDLNFDWHTVSIDKYPQVAQDGSRNIADVTDTFGDLDVFRRHGGKLLTFVGGNDQLIMPRGVINYYRQMASRFGQGAGKGPDFERLQEFYRLFRAPGVGHCGGGSGPQPQNLFDALVNRVENGAAPDQILAQTAGGVVKRPLCPYPQTAIYNGTGNKNDAASFHCGGDLEAPEVVCADVPTKYKHEVNAVRRSGEWRTIYLRKKAQGKTAKQALVVVAVKLLHAVYAMLKHRQPYNPSRLLVASATIGS